MAKHTYKELLEENKKLRAIVASYEADEDYDYDRDEEKVNRWVSERLAREDEANDRRAAEDPDYALELRQIRYLESRYDYEY